MESLAVSPCGGDLLSATAALSAEKPSLAVQLLMTAELPHSQPLNVYLTRTLQSATAQTSEAFFAFLGQEIARLHATGFNQPDLFSTHVPRPRGRRIVEHLLSRFPA